MRTLFNSIFRAFSYQLGKLIFWLLIGGIVFLIFGKKDVFAVDFSYSSSTYDVSFSNCGMTGTICSVPGIWNGQQNLGVRQDNPGSIGGYLALQDRYSFRIYGGTTYTYKASNTYLLQITFSTTYDSFNNLRSRYEVPRVIGYTNSSATGATDEFISSYTSSLTRVDGYDNRYILSISFVPSSDIKFIGVYYYAKELTSSFVSRYSPMGNITYNALKVTYTEGTNAFIQQQTAVIKENFERLKELMKESNDKMEDIYTNDTENSDGTCGGIVCNLKKVVKAVINFPETIFNSIIDAIKSLFIPKDMSFINDFVDSIEDKLGFIASIPMQSIEFLLNLATVSWNEVTSIQFPSISIFGYNFWGSQSIDLAPAMGIIQPFKYLTNLGCVILMINTLLKWWNSFAGGGKE